MKDQESTEQLKLWTSMIPKSSTDFKGFKECVSFGENKD